MLKGSNTTTTSDEPRLALGGRTIIPGLAVGHAAFHWVVQSFVVALPEIQQTFGLSGVGVGGILAARELATAAVKLPGGVAVDALRRYWGTVLAACLGASALGLLILGSSPVYPLLLVGIAVVAISHSIWHLPASAALSHHYSERRGVTLAIHGVGGSVGDVAGPVVTGALLAYLTWRGLLSIYAVAPLFLGIVAIWAFRNIGPRSEEERAETTERSEVTRRLLRSPVLWGLAAVYGFRAMALVALVTILPLYLDNDLGLSPSSRGVHVGLLIAIGLVAKPLTGYLSDKLGRKQVLGPGLVWSCALALGLLLFDSGVLLTACIALLGLFLYPDQPILTATVFDAVDSEVASTGLGFVSFVGSLMAVASPLIAGGLYEGLGFEAVVYYVAGLFGLATVVFVGVPRAKRDAK